MSGRVGDLSPKQAETLAKVRRDAPQPPVGPQREMAESEAERIPGPCLHLLTLHVLDIVSLPSPLKGSHLTQFCDMSPARAGITCG